jgi:hypothetical protein
MAEHLPSAPFLPSDKVGVRMAPPSTFGEAKSFAIIQKSQGLEAVAAVAGLPYEAKNVYRITALSNYVVPPSSSDQSAWNPSHAEIAALQPNLVVSEDSSFCNRCITMFCGVGNLRSLRLDFNFTGTTDASYFVERDFRCGGLFCCPLEMYLFGGDRHNARPVGRVRERFSPWCSGAALLCCQCTTIHDVEVAEQNATFRRLYSLRANLACCGRVSNCCRPSCFGCSGCHSAVYDILDADGNVVTHVQKPFAGRNSCCKALYRNAFKYSNFIVTMPDGASDDEKALLLTSALQLNYQMFEKKGGNNN